jgi:acetylornithine deacetylase/succinyl-diaminopimelate desuccinylase-like protein
MKSDDGHVLIEGFYDDVVPLGNAEKRALDEMPNNDADLERELQFVKPEGGGQRLVELLQKEERLSNPHVVRVVKDVWNYRASRTSMEFPVSRPLVQLVQDTTGGSAVIAPTLGGSVPMYIFEDLGLPWIGVPIVNYDNHQHSSDENLRLGQFWRGMEIYGAILADLNW